MPIAGNESSSTVSVETTWEPGLPLLPSSNEVSLLLHPHKYWGGIKSMSSGNKITPTHCGISGDHAEIWKYHHAPMYAFTVLFDFGPVISNICQRTQKEPYLPLPCITGLLTLVSAVNSEMACDPAPAFLSHGLEAVLPAQDSSKRNICPYPQRQAC